MPCRAEAAALYGVPKVMPKEVSEAERRESEGGIMASDIVLSGAGNDAGDLFFVLDTNEGYALLVDGKRRRLTSPKRKKFKHMKLVSKGDSQLAEMLKTVTDSEIRKALAVFRSALNQRSREGE